MEQPDSLVQFIQKLKDDGVPAEEHNRRINLFIEKKARRNHIPFKGMFELTPLCNLDCKMCYVHLEGTKFSSASLLQTSTWTSLIDQACKAGMLRANLTGGECLTYPGFDEIYLHLCRHGISPAILTNGALLDAERIEFLKCHRPRIVQISLYGSSEESYEQMAGHRVFNRVVENIKMLRDANINVKVAITPNISNFDDLPALLKVAESLNVPYTVNSGLLPPREETGRTFHDLTSEQYVELRRIRRKADSPPVTPLDPNDLPDAQTGHEVVHGLPCGGGTSSFSINYDGSMSPCTALGEIKTYPLETGFDVAWKQLNKLADSYLYPQECVGCPYREVCVHCVARHKNAPAQGHCDQRICDRTRMLVASGYVVLPSN